VLQIFDLLSATSRCRIQKVIYSILHPEVIQLPDVLWRPRPIFAATRHQRMWRVYIQLLAINNIRKSPPTGSSGRLAPSGVHLFIIVAPMSGDATTGGVSAGDFIQPSSLAFIPLPFHPPSAVSSVGVAIRTNAPYQLIQWRRLLRTNCYTTGILCIIFCLRSVFHFALFRHTKCGRTTNDTSKNKTTIVK